jgi:hypothetical protein
MANIKNLKKDISYLVHEVISDSQLYLFLNPAKHNDEVYSIVEDAVKLYNQLFDRVNHPDGKDSPKLVKQHYRAIREDLFEETHKLFERISRLHA